MYTLNNGEKKYIESRGNFTFKFEGTNEIDIDTLSTTMSNMVEIFRHITVETEPEAYVKIKLSAVESGSFNVDLSAIVGVVKNLFNKELLDTAKNIIESFLFILMIKKHLEGRKPLEIKYERKKAKIKNHRGRVLEKPKEITETFFTNCRIDRAIVNIFGVLNRDKDRKGISILRDNKREIEIKKQEYLNMEEEIVEPPEPIETKREKMNIDLPVKNLDFGNKKWEFWLTGKVIEAKIIDEEWKEKVNTGKIGNFSAGDKIPVELIVEYDIDKDGVIEKSYRYEIVKVTGEIIKPSKQIKLDLEYGKRKNKEE